MSTTPDTELDLESLFLPARAKHAPDPNRYAHHSGEDQGDSRREGRREDRRGARPPRRDSPRASAQDQQRAPRREGDRPPFKAKGKFQRRERDERREAPVPLPDLDVSFRPEEKGVDSLARQIK